jgi:hypothetical protein
VTSYGYSALLRRVLVLPMAASLMYLIPSILLNQSDQIAIFHELFTLKVNTGKPSRVPILDKIIYVENDDPQPQLLVECGLMKLKP